MRVPFSWLKEYVPDISASPGEVAEKLQKVGVPVVSVEILGKGIQGVYAGKIIQLEPHPNADKLRVAQVDFGTERVQIVTGAQNVALNDIIPVARLGATLAEGKSIKEAKLRGLPSYGMMCSANELALAFKDDLPPAQREGVMILDSDIPVGINLNSMLALNEAVFVLEPFANRPDYLSIFGIAREVAAIYGVELHPPKLFASGKGSPDEKIKLHVEDRENCSRYLGRFISNVKVRPSPLGMAVRLSAAGIHPINNIVDITNYVLLELGQPLHAFDYGKLSGGLYVRHAHPSEKLIGIDGKTYELTKEMPVIADAKKAVAIAGVMGGKETEITDSTHDVFLESAHFLPGAIRRTSLKLGIRTESSRRFEKGLDPFGVEWGSRRACFLLNQTGANVSDGQVDFQDKPVSPQEIGVSLTRLKKVLGVEDLERDQVRKIFAGLGFEIKSDTPFVVQPPVLRTDIKEEIDVVEEVARHYRYDRVPTHLPQGMITIDAGNPDYCFETKLREALSRLGLCEVMTYSLGDPAYYSRVASHPLALIQNPLTEDRKALRPLLYPEMLLCLKRNIHLKNKDLALFEIGKVFEWRNQDSPKIQDSPDYSTGGNLVSEKRHVAVVLTGKLSWGAEASFFVLKGILEKLWERFHLSIPLELQGSSNENFHPLRYVELRGEEMGTVPIGFLGELHPRFLESIGIDEKVMVLELSVDVLQPLERKAKLKPIPLYPESRRDVSMIVDEKIPAGEVQAKILKAGGKLVEEVRIFDVYQGSQIPQGEKSIALGIIYRSSEKTLTDEEVSALHAKILSELEKSFKSKLRV